MTTETTVKFSGLIYLRDFSYGSFDAKYHLNGDARMKDGRVTDIPAWCTAGRRQIEAAVATGARAGRIGQWEWSLYPGA